MGAANQQWKKAMGRQRRRDDVYIGGSGVALIRGSERLVPVPDLSWTPRRSDDRASDLRRCQTFPSLRRSGDRARAAEQFAYWASLRRGARPRAADEQNANRSERGESARVAIRVPMVPCERKGLELR
nr:unnamed protein product [Digitaria exilis]CAB3501929.1 unnamed protein product [Digitaria exilis]